MFKSRLVTTFALFLALAYALPALCVVRAAATTTTPVTSRALRWLSWSSPARAGSAALLLRQSSGAGRTPGFGLPCIAEPRRLLAS